MSNLKWMYNPEWEYWTLVPASERREADKDYGIGKIKRELIAANERIKRLEEAGDQLSKWADRNTPVTILNDWTQAKEAKP